MTDLSLDIFFLPQYDCRRNGFRSSTINIGTLDIRYSTKKRGKPNRYRNNVGRGNWNMYMISRDNGSELARLSACPDGTS